MYSTIPSRWSRLQSHADITGKAIVAGAAGEEEDEDKLSAGRVVLGEGGDLEALYRSSLSMRRRSSYTSRVRLRIRAKR